MATEMRITMPDATAAELRRVAALHGTTPGEAIRRLLVLRKRILGGTWESERKFALEACIGKVPNEFRDTEPVTAETPLPAGDGTNG